MFVLAVHSCSSTNREGDVGGVADMLVREYCGEQRGFIYPEVGSD